MGDNTAIEWTDATWNPIRARNRASGKVGWFCTHASTGCVNCYAEDFNHRLGTGIDFKAQNRELVELFVDEAMLAKPLSWRRPRKIFVGSMTDLFGDFVTDEMIDRVVAVMALCPHHTFQVLTKRPERMRAYVSDGRGRPVAIAMASGAIVSEANGGGHVLEIDVVKVRLRWPLPNVWLGVSAEDQTRADERIPILLDTPAAKRFVSLEPLLSRIRLRRLFTLLFAFAEGLDSLTGALEGMFGDPCAMRLPALDQVIVGGESGPRARPMHPDWARQIRDDCAAAGVPFLFKQWGEWAPGAANSGKAGDGLMAKVGKKAAGRTLDGVIHDGFPEIQA